MSTRRPFFRGLARRTAFGEPLWLDALKTLGVAAVMTLLAVVLGGALALMIISPWGRASPDCSMWCVLDQELRTWRSDSRS